MVEALLDAFGSKIGGGYDIGCKFGITLARSPLGCRAKALQYRALVGSFHGHVHNRLCQLQFLATYVKGMGLEDLEGGERYFSKSNALAASVRHASIFHRKQKNCGICQAHGPK
jgi:Kyakuja-Dileera-Zisupton transposase